MTTTRIVLLALLSMVLFTGYASAQTPPGELEGSYSPTDNAVELRWHEPDVNPAPDHYNVYRRPDGEPGFQLLITAFDRRYDDADVAPGTTYLYRVTAVYAGPMESSPTNTVIVHTPATGDSTGDSTIVSIHFESSPVLSAQVGELYQYQAVVTTDPPGLDVCFELRHAPEGMSVNPTGLISWTPAFLGVFEVEVKARICGGSEDDEQEFHIMVISGAAARLHGTVTDSLGHPIDSVRIKIFDATAGVFLLKTRTNSSGEYGFPVVNPGTYFVRADVEGENFEDVWYVYARELADATPVIVPESGNAVVNFVLRAGEHEPDENFTVTGTVRDTSGIPVPGASVALLKLFHHGGDRDNLFDDDCDHGDDHGGDDAERSATTDSSGNYQITAHAGGYLVRSRAHGFFPQYWDGQPSPLEAIVLSLHSDTGNINFALTPRPDGMEGTGSISGTVRRSDNFTPLRGEVLGFMKNSSGHFTGLISSDHTDSSGSYTLDELPAGFYLVMVKGEDGIIPTFYSLAGGTVFMDSASLVPVADGPVTGIDINVGVDSAEGLNDISGEVEIEIETPGKNNPVRPPAGVPLAGAMVTVIGNGGRAVGYGISGKDGLYNAPGLAAGNYTVIFQKPGAGTSSAIGSVAYQAGMPGTTIINASLLPDAGNGSANLMGVNTGWNLVSVPVTPPDFSTLAVFPSATTSAYAYAGAYQTTATLLNGLGYWLKFNATQVVNIEGDDITFQSIPIARGWNIIGSVSSPVPVASLSTQPPGLITSGVFGYSGGYQGATTIQPGKGYWIRASDPGTLQLQGSENASLTVPAVPGSGGLTLTFGDDFGDSQTLSVSGDRNAANTLLTELPPTPPSGAFDVRFATGTITVLAPAPSDGPVTYPIAVQSVGGNLTVSISGLIDGSVAILSGPDGREIASSRGGPTSARLAGVRDLTLSLVSDILPQAYRLEQNYPNPFNPTTSIALDLPVDSRVSLRVYNALGQLVGNLVDEIRIAGHHTVVWNAGNAASGVYFVRFQADPVEEAGRGYLRNMKMLLVR